ncbi:hypothetical protein ARMGADRAFT_1039628 [Armillaria gallica]|uniref:Uncharacterized protein n=1 Tax=Armillaria gallica TaxID=47427 RepID=A0A2H3CP80_ARMGA|nr:hypothetical protein ARMGADRAFT_1039628 [Armillaria gallica]
MVPEVFYGRGNVMAIGLKSPFLVPVGLAAPTELGILTHSLIQLHLGESYQQVLVHDFHFCCTMKRWRKDGERTFDKSAILPSPSCLQLEGGRSGTASGYHVRPKFRLGRNSCGIDPRLVFFCGNHRFSSQTSRWIVVMFEVLEIFRLADIANETVALAYTNQSSSTLQHVSLVEPQPLPSVESRS